MNDNSNETELIITSTHSIKESKGSALGLEGNQAFYVIGAFIISVAVSFAALMNKWSYAAVFLGFLGPLALSYIYLLLFHINKPPGYQKDLISKLLNGSDYDIRKKRHKANPYLSLKRRSD